MRLARRVAARHALHKIGCPVEAVEARHGDERASTRLQPDGGVAPPDLARAPDRQLWRGGHQQHEAARGDQTAQQPQLGEEAHHPANSDDGDGVATPALLDEPPADLVRDVGRELLVVGAGQVVEKGELACAEEDLCDAQLVVGLVQPEREQQNLAKRGRVEHRDALWHDVLVPLVERVVRTARREALVHQPQRLHHARAAQLVEDVAARERARLLLSVWVDAAHERRICLAQVGEQRGELTAEVRRDAGEPSAARALAGAARAAGLGGD
mmetsp:Transcript_34620/g.114037  ORF Transcript_34620/g.114037 Transcript_34620/m.114037 type:complete len:270 (-) Transcript_34620:1968-2777(-)